MNKTIILSHIDTLIDKYNKQVKLLNEVKKEMEFAKDKVTPEDEILLRERMEYVYKELMTDLEGIYGFMPNIAYYAAPSARLYQNPAVQKTAKQLVSVKICNKNVYIKMPRLPKKYKRTGILFTEELRLILDEYEVSHLLPHYKQCTVSFIHVYDRSFDTRVIPDNDNVDIKRTLDIISDFITGSDHAPNVKLVLQSLRSDKIHEGTYIYVSEQDSNNPNMEDFIVKNFPEFAG